LDLCHYYLHDFEGHHYYSSNCAGAITILHLFEIRHFIRQTPSVVHLQAYRRPSYFRMDEFALPSHFTDMRDPHVSLLQPPAPSPSIDSPPLSHLGLAALPPSLPITGSLPALAGEQTRTSPTRQAPPWTITASGSDPPRGRPPGLERSSQRNDRALVLRPWLRRPVEGAGPTPACGSGPGGRRSPCLGAALLRRAQGGAACGDGRSPIPGGWRAPPHPQASYTPAGGPRTASGVQNGVFQTSAKL
jgi:hypothetical protein